MLSGTVFPKNTIKQEKEKPKEEEEIVYGADWLNETAQREFGRSNTTKKVENSASKTRNFPAHSDADHSLNLRLSNLESEQSTHQ